VDFSPRSAWRAIPALLGAGLALVGCQDGYPIAPTRCDHWCDLRQATECGNYDPTSCVVSCEQASGGAACFDAFDELLSCLRVHESTIACRPSSFGVVPECSAEQAKLYRCGMKAPTANE